MTGTQSLSFAQMHTVMDEVNRLEIEARRSQRYADTDQGRVYTGQPVTIVVHQAEPWLRVENGRKADKRVQIHRAFTDSYEFVIDRDGGKARLFG